MGEPERPSDPHGAASGTEPGTPRPPRIVLLDRYLGNATWPVLAVVFLALIMNPVTVVALRAALAALVAAVVALNIPTCALLYRDFRAEPGSTRVTLRMVSLLLRFGATALAVQMLVDRATSGTGIIVTP